ncbi:MAG: Fic family protein [Saprospiraceae bacterium]
MLLLNPQTIQVEPDLLHEIDVKSKSIFRAITFCKKTSSKTLLDAFINSTNSLTELLSIKNAQMEAESEEELIQYQKDLNKAILYIINEIKNETSFTVPLQLFQIFRLTSPESHQLHPNRYRNKLVQVGSYICPTPERVPNLVTQLFLQMESIKHPLLKAIYFHHELIRIHPFIDGNGRTTRIAKNWLLMYHLYPPIFIKDEVEKKEYVEALSASFKAIDQDNSRWHAATHEFFLQELRRMANSIQFILDEIRSKTA